MKIGYLDCFSGAAGDMLVGACLDVGVPLAHLTEGCAKLGLPGWTFQAERVRRGSLSGSLFSIRVIEDPAPPRRLRDIEQIVSRAAFPAALEARMLQAYRGLAEAEARVHGVPVADVHFHEVGAMDAILDVCATVLAFDALGLAEVHASEIVVGTGTTRCEHGVLPVPAPATLELLRGLPVRHGAASGERCTPTGAALLRVLVDRWQEPVSFRPERIGYGAGQRDGGPVPNLLRLTVGNVPDDRGADQVWELSLQVDNVSGEVLAAALERVFAGGALDAWVSPTLTKKNRPAHWVVVLSDDARRPELEDLLLAELPTLGLRRQRVERRTLPRRVEERDTPLGRMRFKVRTLPDGSELAHPEADDVERLAREHGLPVPVVLARIASPR